MRLDIDYGSSAAISYNRYFQKLLEDARVQNDGLDVTPERTNQLRGRIALLKELLALPTQKSVMDAQARIEHPDE
jgi:hypothetical protein